MPVAVPIQYELKQVSGNSSVYNASLRFTTFCLL